jgi:hypothetical protein
MDYFSRLNFSLKILQTHEPSCGDVIDGGFQISALTFPYANAILEKLTGFAVLASDGVRLG